MLGKLVEFAMKFPQYVGILVDLMEKFTGPEGESWTKEFKRFLRKEKAWAYTKFLGGGITLNPRDPNNSINDAGRFCRSVEDTRIFGGRDHVSESRSRDVIVHEFLREGCFLEEVLQNLEHKYKLTQAEIVEFLERHCGWVEECKTYLLFMQDGKLFVVTAFMPTGEKLKIKIEHLERNTLKVRNHERIVLIT